MRLDSCTINIDLSVCKRGTGEGGITNPEEITKREEKKSWKRGGLRPPPSRAKSSFLTAETLSLSSSSPNS
jgi:hypothetical protein